nr:transposase [Pseudenhygromyxa sp. WMMC2535]
MGRSERREALANYMRGLLLDGERKSMVPIAQRLAAIPRSSGGPGRLVYCPLVKDEGEAASSWSARG